MSCTQDRNDHPDAKYIAQHLGIKANRSLVRSEFALMAFGSVLTIISLVVASMGFSQVYGGTGHGAALNMLVFQLGPGSEPISSITAHIPPSFGSSYNPINNKAGNSTYTCSLTLGPLRENVPGFERALNHGKSRALAGVSGQPLLHM